MQGGDGVPPALMADADLDGSLADAEADEGLAFLQDVVARIGGGWLAEGVFDDSGIDPGDRRMGGGDGASVGLLGQAAVRRAGCRHGPVVGHSPDLLPARPAPQGAASRYLLGTFPVGNRG
jgi:hypothetical protein